MTETSATGGGTVTADGGALVTSRGICWSTSADPTTADSHTSDGTGTGTFVSALSGLTPGTTYHVRAYAVNSAGTAYGDDLTFSTVALVTKGDVNNDTAIDVFDALLTLQYAVGLTHPVNEIEFKAAADVAPLAASGKPLGDAQVNVFDALAILRHAVGLDPW
jgi:hypothetical protein